MIKRLRAHCLRNWVAHDSQQQRGDYMPNVFYLIEEKQVEADAKETTSANFSARSIPHAHACGGTARCSTCRVLIAEGLEHCTMRNDKEQKLAERLHFSPRFGWRVRLRSTAT